MTPNPHSPAARDTAADTTADPADTTAADSVADTSGSVQSAQSPFTVTHKWPWRAGEFGTMTFFAAVCLGIGYLTSDRWGVLIGVAAALGSTALLYRTKTRRVNESAVTATLTGNRLVITSDGLLGKSAVDLTKVSTIGYRRFGSDECFMLSDGTQGARFPVRLLATDLLRERLDATWAAAREHSPTADDLYQRTHNA